MNENMTPNNDFPGDVEDTNTQPEITEANVAAMLDKLTIDERAALISNMTADQRSAQFSMLAGVESAPVPIRPTKRDIMQAHIADALGTEERLAAYIAGKLALRHWLNRTAVYGDGGNGYYDLTKDIAAAIREALPHLDLFALELIAKGESEY